MTGTRFGIETVREAVRRRVADTSLRQVAAEIPMSFSGLRSFLEGGTPQLATRANLVAWYAERATVARSEVRREDVDMAIAFLRIYLDSSRRPQIRARKLADILKRLGSS